MKKNFALGAIAGITSMALAVPMLAQVSSAQTSSATSSTTSAASTNANNFFFKRMNFTQEDVQTLIDRDNAFLTNADAMLTVLKAATQDHRNALQAAEAITDDTERQAAVKAADEAFHAAIHKAVDANADLKGVMMPFGGMGHGGRHMHGPGDLAAKLGMTEAELKTALDSGKTIEQIAEEKGITLPARPQWNHQIDNDDATTNQSSSSIQ